MVATSVRYTAQMVASSEVSAGQTVARRTREAITTETLERDTQAFAMAARGCTPEEIQIALGYHDLPHVHNALRRHTRRLMVDAGHVHHMRQVCDEQLAMLWRKALTILEGVHLKVNNGYVVYYTEDPDTNPNAKSKPLHDSAPVLSAIREMVKIQESRRKLWGIDAPVKHEVAVSQVTVTVRGADDV